MMTPDVTLRLSRDEAIVFFEWLARFNDRPDESFEDQAEQRVLWDLEAKLEPQIDDLFSPDYDVVLEAARARVRDVQE